MTLVPRFLLSLLAGMRVARFARGLKKQGRGTDAQRAVFADRMTQIAGTEFASLHGLQADTPYDYFREKVPVRTYDWFEPFIQRMSRGESNILVQGHCPFFVETAGSTGESAKLLPAPGAMLAHFRDALRDAIFHYAHRAGHSRVFLGRHLQVGASTAVTEVEGSFRTSLDGIMMLCLTPWAEENLRAPAVEVSELPEGSVKIESTARSMLRQDVRLIAGTPAWVCALSLAAREFSSVGKQRVTQLQAVWPNFECFLHTGAPLGLFADALRSSLGPSVRFHEVYAAAEGIFAAQDDGSPTGMRILADSDIFFEFLPYSMYSESNLGKAGAQCVPLDQVQLNVDYVPIITTPAGLVRYVTGDIVRFITLDPPRIQFVGRTSLELNTHGENVTERDALETLQAVCIRNGWQPIAFHVAPYEQRHAAGQVVSVHEWWLELRTHTIKTPTANVLGPEIDAELARRCPGYAQRRARGEIGSPLVRLVMPGVFESWAREHRKIASPSKMPRCRPDRLIADQLAALAPFHQATLIPSRETSLRV